MKAFELDQRIVGGYANFSRSFMSVRAGDLRSGLERHYEAGRFWPDALLSINPHFETGASVTALVQDGVLHPQTAPVFRKDGEPINLYRHQREAVCKAATGKSIVVTTGTGSGKSLCFFVPIVDAAIRAREAGDAPGIRAIIVYPMNALANSQLKEIEGYLEQSGLPEALRPTVRRYTGQESPADRLAVKNNPPDILLTNFMMLELLMTRQDEVDRTVIRHASALKFIVLDELHTYRGRQGSDVAVLIRRLRQRCSAGGAITCIGTSATMASEGSDESRAQAVAEVASRLFATELAPDGVIDETLKRSTDPERSVADVAPYLAEAVAGYHGQALTDAELKSHPLAIWIELELGLSEGKTRKRRPAIPLGDAVDRLAAASGQLRARCEEVLRSFLTMASQPETARGGTSYRAFMAFKLHRFIAGSGEVFTTLRPAPRSVVLDAQTHDPDDPASRLYPTRFCRDCGQEYHVVLFHETESGREALPRGIDETPVPSDDQPAGYLTPWQEPCDGFRFDPENVETYPEEWRDLQGEVPRLKSDNRPRRPRLLHLHPDGTEAADGRPFYYLPGRFPFCLACGSQPAPQARERSKLAGLSAEGRSSATTLVVSTVLQWMNDPANGVPEEKRKLLGFTDNRQDAALQAGHFNDFLFVSLLRGALLRAVLDAGDEGLGDDGFGTRVARALRFAANREETRRFWLSSPEGGNALRRIDAERALARVLAHRVWADLRRGWRYTNPSLGVLDLVRPEFQALDAVLEDEETLLAAVPVFREVSREQRRKVVELLLSAMLEGLAVATESLDPLQMDTVAQSSRSLLRAPWAIDAQEVPRRATALVVAPGAQGADLLKGGAQSAIGRAVNRPSLLGRRLPRAEYLETMTGLVGFLEGQGLLRRVTTAGDVTGWQIEPSVIRLLPGPAATDPAKRGNAYFHDLYTGLADALAESPAPLLGLEAREHTAQVPQEVRLWREDRFRFEADDRARLKDRQAEMRDAGESDQFLPALFCSPTMELGVDISALNAVYLRNVPPTPANYAQRAGRAGRSGQAAVITTYCAALSPHDQYYFRAREAMVSGVVRPPALDLGNEHLVRAHLHAVWLAVSEIGMEADIPRVLDLTKPDYPLADAIRERAFDPALPARAAGPMREVVAQVAASLSGDLPAWPGDPDAFVAQVAEDAPKCLDQAFERWRVLYRSAHEQLRAANLRLQQPGLPGRDRTAAQGASRDASEQIRLLEEGRATSGSDFYSYRYLATEGFLPGYNFPRLPLYAFIPAGAGGGQSAFLSRARFLAISEFGPRSLIYHEGRAYRVHKVKLSAEARDSSGQGLATRTVWVCDDCGAAHETEVERCHACASPMASATAIRRAFRVDNVETMPVERITANDEERVRQGFDVQTVFAWPQRRGGLDVDRAELVSDGEPILGLQYGESALISRLNKGLKRRKHADEMGFWIDPVSGRWSRLDDEADGEAPDRPDRTPPQRIVPIVQDNKNALLLRWPDPAGMSPTTHATVQYALLRGIDAIFQLEEGEILGEPLPARDRRRTVLLYEASEGGAGVLARLLSEPTAMARVAAEALRIIHSTPASVEAALHAGDASLLVDEADAPCVHGCYRCLLSYFNQPDHLLIDRTDEHTRRLLVALAKGSVSRVSYGTSAPAAAPAPASAPAIGPASDLPPSDGPGNIAGIAFPQVWRRHLVAGSQGEPTDDQRRAADSEGWEIVDLSQPEARDQLTALMGETA